VAAVERPDQRCIIRPSRVTRAKVGIQHGSGNTTSSSERRSAQRRAASWLSEPRPRQGQPGMSCWSSIESQDTSSDHGRAHSVGWVDSQTFHGLQRRAMRRPAGRSGHCPAADPRRVDHARRRGLEPDVPLHLMAMALLQQLCLLQARPFLSPKLAPNPGEGHTPSASPTWSVKSAAGHTAPATLHIAVMRRHERGIFRDRRARRNLRYDLRA
jgi:hypothetical protein